MSRGPLSDAGSRLSLTRRTSPGLSVRRNLKGKLYAAVLDCCWAADSIHLATVSGDAQLQLWSARDDQQLAAITLNSGASGALALAPSMRMAAVADPAGCTLYDIPFRSYKKSKEVKQIPHRKGSDFSVQLSGHEGVVNSCEFFDDSSLLTCASDWTSILWDVEKQAAKRTFEGHTDAIVDQSIFREKGLFLTAADDSTIKVWDSRADSAVQTFERNALKCVKWFRNGMSFVSGSWDSTIVIWDVRTEKLLNELKSEDVKEELVALDCSVSGRYVFAGYRDGFVRVWDSVFGDLLQEIKSSSLTITQVQTSPDGTAIAASSFELSVKVIA